MIRPLAMARWASAVLYGAVIAFLLVGVVANTVSGATGDAVELLGCVAVFAALAAVPWLQFVRVDTDGLTYRNRYLTRSLAWGDIDAFATRRLFRRYGGGIVVVARLRSGRRVTLRATGRGTSYGRPGSPGRQFVLGLVDELNEALLAARATARR